MRYVPEPYQKLMIKHLLGNREGALFVGMSLGKTAATLYALCELFENFAITGALVVAPLRVANVAWSLEVEKWDQFRWLEIANLRTPEGRQKLADGSAHLYIINYEMLPTFKEKYLKRKRSVPFQAVVWDEISMAKNHKSTRVNSVRRLIRKHCDYHWGLTGTPMPNHYLDLFAQVRLLDGGERLSPEYTRYRGTYFYQPNSNQPYRWELQDGAKERIHNRLRGFALSMATSDYLDIPDMVYEDEILEMPKKTRSIYTELEDEFITILESGDELVAVNSAVLAGKLLQMTSGAVYKDEEKNVEILNSKKVETTKKLLKKTGNTIVVYNYQHELERLKKAIPDAVLFAEAKGEKAEKALCNRWNSGKIKTLLVHPQSMSHGLNLQGGGSDVIWVSLTYSRERFEQLNRRLARRGQTNVTRIYRILMDNTIDYAVAAVLESKGNRQEILLKALKQNRINDSNAR